MSKVFTVCTQSCFLSRSNYIPSSMESADSSSTASPLPHLPPGFRFHPTDEELVVHYLKKKLASQPLPVSIMAEIDLYKFDPWELPERASFGEQEWYFFSPRDRKYPNGSRPNRAATSGYWKATGTDKPVVSNSNNNQKVGVKKSLVFYTGKPPKGIKTNWIMHEFRVVDNAKSTCKLPPACDAAQRGSLKLDEWVLCRIYKKTDTPSARQEVPMFFSPYESPDHMSQSITHEERFDQEMQTSNYLAFLENEQNINMFDQRVMMTYANGLMMPPHQAPTTMLGPSSLVGIPTAKQSLLPSTYWNVDEHSTSSTSTSTGKGYLMENCDQNVAAGVLKREEDNTMACLMDQQQQAMLGLGSGSFADGTRIDWYS